MKASDVSSNPASSKARGISFYKVPLECAAAPQIGCGSRAKPVLLELEEQGEAVDAAWLNRTGTVIVVVWNPDTSEKLRENIAERLFQKNKLPVRRAGSDEHHRLIDEFHSGNPWYRGSEVDKLSTEEAKIIAERLVNRISDKISIAEEKQQIIKDKFILPLKKELTQTFSPEINIDEEAAFEPAMKRINQELLEIARVYLNSKQLSVLNEALDQGYRPTQEENKTERSGNFCCSSSNNCQPEIGTNK